MVSDNLFENQVCPADVNKREWMAKPDGYGKNTGACGDTVEIFIASHGDQIQDLYYLTNGCAATHLCASTVIQLVKSQDVENAWQLRPKHIIAYLQDLPADHHHCAELAAGALYRALIDMQNNRRKPWAKYYRTPLRNAI